jgi:hypothetical protein
MAIVNRLRGALSGLAGALIAASLSAAALAQPFIVQGVEIDATAGSAFEAQRQAMSDGQVRAAQILIERLTLPEDRFDRGLEFIAADTAAGLIAGLQISDEQRSSTRYRGVLAVEFDRRAVGRFFEQMGVPYVESPASPVLVIPISDAGAGPVISRGAWGEAWANGGFENALTPFIPFDPAGPAGGLVSVSDALSMNEFALQAAAELYGVNAVAVVTARSGAGAVRTGGNLMRFTDEGAILEPLPQVTAGGGYAAAAARFVADRELAWKRAAIVRDASQAELSVTVLYDSVVEWRRLQTAVAGAVLIQDARLDALSRRGATMTLVHRGTREQLSAELAARGAQLFEDADLGWTVRSRR